MKVLLRKWGDKYYVWKSAEWKDSTYYVADGDGDDVEVSQTNILAVDEDNRVGYVVCANCGKLIKNDPESIEAHYTEEESKKDCMMCEYLRFSNRKLINSTGVKNEDGSYTVTQIASAILNCSTNYWTKPIDSNEAERDCKYKRCRKSGVTDIDDIFVKYPGIFEKFITVDTLLDKNCEYKGRVNGFFEYDLKLRGNLVACVNEMGIVDHFRIYYRGYAYDSFYSDKYNIIFTAGYHRYKSDVPRGVPDKKMEQIKEKIAAFYKEANK